MKQLGLNAQISLQCRFEMITPEFLDGLDGLNTQLEFGLQTVIPKEYTAIGRPNNLDKIEMAITELHTIVESILKFHLYTAFHIRPLVVLKSRWIGVKNMLFLA